MKTLVAAIVTALAFSTAAFAADDKPDATSKPAVAAAAPGEWGIISDEITAKMMTDKDKKNEQTAGIAVDRTNGDVYMLINAKGIVKSTDQGKIWEFVSEKNVSGRCETPFAMNADPAGKRLMVSVVYGQCGRTDDAGKTWTKSKLSHVDYIAVDWEATGKDMLTVKHESGGVLAFSNDAGVSYKDLGKSYSGPLAVFDDKIIMARNKDGWQRSTDGGATWAAVEKGIPADAKAVGQVAYVFKGKAYVVTDKGLLVSSDKGATWAIQGEPVAAVIGPFFGKTENDIAVVGKGGISRTTDGGKTWKVVAPLSPIGITGAGATYAWDPVNNIFYSSQMSKPGYKLVVKE